jgi:TonB family protein
MSPADISARRPPELNLLRLEEKPVSSRHLLAMGLASIVVHLVLGTVFLSLPEVIPPKRGPIVTSQLHKAVHIYLPKTFEATQKAPNQNKIVHPELDVRSEIETPQTQAPKVRRPQPPPGPVVRAIPPPPVIEPPKIQVPTPQPPPVIATTTPPPPITGAIPQAPPPPEASKPKIAFENVAPPKQVQVNGIPDPRLLMQKAAMDRIREQTVTPKAAGGGGLTVGDVGDDLSDLPRLNQTQSKGKVGSNLQLLSDPNGYDFKPYLMKILASVRRNWMAIIPESASMGRRGQVLIQFIIDRNGGVPKLVIASSSGTQAYDRAAVSGITASTPFPPLPADFKGDQVRLQLSFSYNAPAR